MVSHCFPSICVHFCGDFGANDTAMTELVRLINLVQSESLKDISFYTVSLAVDML
jgi:hypothetical protein